MATAFSLEKAMPKGPRGEKRPADANSCAVLVAKIATGQAPKDAVAAGRSRSGKAGGAARATALSADQRSRIAKKAAESRWNRPSE